MADEQNEPTEEQQRQLDTPVLAPGASGDPLNPAAGVPGYLTPPSLQDDEVPDPPQTPTGPLQPGEEPSPVSQAGVQPTDVPARSGRQNK